MSIVQVTFSLSGGAGSVASRLNRSLGQRGFNSQIVFATTKDAKAIRNSHPIVFSEALLDYLLVRRNLDSPLFSLFRTSPCISDNVITEINPSLVHLHWAPGTVNLMGTLLSNENKIPLVWTLHDMWPLTGGCHQSMECNQYTANCAHCPQARRPFSRRVGLSQKMKHSILQRKKSVCLVAPSKWMGNIASQSFVARDHRIEVVPNPIEDVFFDRLDPVYCRQAIGIDHDAFVVGVASANLGDPNKNIRDAIDAAIKLATQEREKKVIVLMIGAGENRKSLRGVKVIQTGYLTDRRQVARAFSAMSVFLSLSRSETAPQVVSEALACGLPIVCRDVGGMVEYLNGNENGLPARTVDDAVSAMRTLIAEESFALKLSKNARKFADSQFREDQSVRKYLSIYESLNDDDA